MLDQEIEKGLDASELALTATSGIGNAFGTGIANRGASVSRVLDVLLKGFDVQAEVEASPFIVNQSWAPGTQRGSILETIGVTCDYFSPWFDNNGILQYIRVFNPALKIPDFDWDSGNQVIRSSILRQSDALTAPNRFIVISNGSGTPDDAVVGTADVPVNAPNSIENRGFVIPSINDLQVLNTAQAQAAAINLMQRQLIFETIDVSTAPDPRHDSYNVVHFRGELWLELGWNMTLAPGAPMSHTIRRAYR